MIDAWTVPYADARDEYSRNPLDSETEAVLDRLDGAFADVPRAAHIDGCMHCYDDAFLHRLEVDDPDIFTDGDIWTATCDMTATLGSEQNLAWFVPVILRAFARGAFIEQWLFVEHLAQVPTEHWTEARRRTLRAALHRFFADASWIEWPLVDALTLPMDESERRSRLGIRDGRTLKSEENALSPAMRFAAARCSTISRPAANDVEMQAALTELEQAFVGATRSNPLIGCPHCFSDDELAVLSATHRDDLTDGQLAIIAFKLGTTLGTRADLLYFVYPIFRAVAGGAPVELERFVWTLIEKLRPRMSTEQQIAVRRYFDALPQKLRFYDFETTTRKLLPRAT